MFVFTCSRSKLIEIKMATINTFLPFQCNELTGSNIKYVLQDFIGLARVTTFCTQNWEKSAKYPFFIFNITCKVMRSCDNV